MPRSLSKRFFAMGLTISEIAVLKTMLKRIPKASSSHLRALLCILEEKECYLSLEEIRKNTLLEGKVLEKIMQSLSKNSLVQKEGCLYRKIEQEKIVEII